MSFEHPPHPLQAENRPLDEVARGIVFYRPKRKNSIFPPISTHFRSFPIWARLSVAEGARHGAFREGVGKRDLA